MEYLLVLQFPETAMDFDEVVELEDSLVDELEELAEVDGHDIGNNEINYFIITEDVESTFAKAQAIIGEKTRALKAAYRELEGEEFIILFPAGLTEFEVS